jgi:polyhydroxybutyrate depolymerase
MSRPFRLTLVLLALSACTADAGGAADEAFEDEDTQGVLASLSCPAHVASNSVHVQAGRAYTTTRYVYFRRVTTYYARGTNQSLGTSATTSTTLYEVGPSTFSLTATGCGVSQSDGAVPTADAGPKPVVDGGVADASPAQPDATTGGSSGCGLVPPTSGGGKTILVNGVSRSYVLAVPTNYDRARSYPLIFAFHGLGGSGSQAQLYFGLAQATQGQAIIVYPDAMGSSRAWGISGASATADLAFFDALVGAMTSSLCVDSTRIFATGHSMGGYFSNTLGCARGDTLRAIAPVAGGGPYLSCSTGKVAAWIFAASDDTVVSSSAGAASRDHWLRKNGCASTTRPVGPGACVAYDACDPAHPVQWCLESTGGHGWPSYGGQAIWSFFRGF